MSKSSTSRRTDDSTVIEHLKQNPDFLTRHPEVLDLIDVPHEVGDASSLLLHQIDRLKQVNARLESRVEQITAMAGQNEVLLKKVQLLVLSLLDAPDLDSLLRALHQGLAEQLDADFSAVLLLDADVASLDASLAVLRDGDDSELSALADFRKRESVLCGRLQPEKLKCLFGDQAGEIASAALIPIRHQREFGVLGIGSKDAERFSPDMGTLFLDFLGASLARGLATQVSPRERKSRAS